MFQKNIIFYFVFPDMAKMWAKFFISFSRKLSQKYKNKIICSHPLAFTASERALKIVVAL